MACPPATWCTEIRAQNVQAAAGVIGASPNVPGLSLQLSVNAQGRLRSVEEFGDIVVKTGARRRHHPAARRVARLELGASDYALRSLLEQQDPRSRFRCSRRPGSNAIQISDNVRAR